MLVTGKLKFFALTKDRKKVTLTGEWDDAENPEKQWVTVNEAEVLFTAGLVKRDGTWPDGNDKFKVTQRGAVLALEKDWKQRGGKNVCVTTIHIGESLGANPSEKVGRSSDKPVDGWVELEARYRQCVTIAVAALEAEKVKLDCHGVVRAANCLFMQANGYPVDVGNDKPEDFEDKPDELTEEGDGLPF